MATINLTEHIPNRTTEHHQTAHRVITGQLLATLTHGLGSLVLNLTELTIHTEV